jgi:hypothetical protein
MSADPSDRTFRGLWVTTPLSYGIPVHTLRVTDVSIELHRPTRTPAVVSWTPQTFVDIRRWYFPYRHFFFIVEGDRLVWQGAFMTLRAGVLRQHFERCGWRPAKGGWRFRSDPPLVDLSP